MPLGKEVGLGPRHNVLDGDPAAPLDGKGHSSSKYGWGFVGAGRAACVRKPRPMFIVAKQSPVSASAELLLHGSWQRAPM